VAGEAARGEDRTHLRLEIDGGEADVRGERRD
jgi:hypothetical protein